jgi:hypothetical protein
MPSIGRHDDRLPQYRVVVSDEFGLGSHGLCRNKQRRIHIGTSLRGKELSKVLLHEMAHAAVPRSGHGRAWVAEMRRLADRGHQQAKMLKTIKTDRGQ